MMQSFAVTETDGHWGRASELPGTAALGAGALVGTLSCAAPGDCAAGGDYGSPSGEEGALVATESHGVWKPASRLNTHGIKAVVSSVSCARPGDCAAVGAYAQGVVSAPFLASEVDGRWGRAAPIPGLATLSAGGNTSAGSISCVAPGDCSTDGSYCTGRNCQVFVDSEWNGTWGMAKRLPGNPALNTGGESSLTGMSCPAPGYCSLGGSYINAYGSLAFVVNQKAGTWQNAEQVPGSISFAPLSQSYVAAVSCGSRGNCGAAGVYWYYSGQQQRDIPFVTDSVDGTWGRARQLPGLAHLDTGDEAIPSAISCAAAGGCTIGGYYTTADSRTEPFVISVG
jgi:hypothetical protein